MGKGAEGIQRPRQPNPFCVCNNGCMEVPYRLSLCYFTHVHWKLGDRLGRKGGICRGGSQNAAKLAGGLDFQRLLSCLLLSVPRCISFYYVDMSGLPCLRTYAVLPCPECLSMSPFLFLNPHPSTVSLSGKPPPTLN